MERCFSSLSQIQCCWHCVIKGHYYHRAAVTFHCCLNISWDANLFISQGCLFQWVPTCVYFQGIRDTYSMHLKPFLSPTNGHSIDSLGGQRGQTRPSDGVAVRLAYWLGSVFFAFSGLEFKAEETEGWWISVTCPCEAQFAREWVL